MLDYNPPTEINQMSTCAESYRRSLSALCHGNPDVLHRFDQFASLLANNEKAPLLLECLIYAAQKHEGQVRKNRDKTPYIIHPLGVAISLWSEGGVKDASVLMAALLHDTLEDTEATQAEIGRRFGSRVGEIVAELTNPEGLTTEQKKEWQIEHAASLTPEAKLVKLADRLYNIRDICDLEVDDPVKMGQWFVWAERLLDALRGTNSALEDLLRQEIEAFKAL